MKKIYAFIMGLLCLSALNAQTRSSKPLQKHLISDNGSRAIGDTLMYVPLMDFYINPIDILNFDVVSEDIDMNNPYNAGFPMEFGKYYSSDTVSLAYGAGWPGMGDFYHPWETPPPSGNDTSYYWAATSYFMPPGTADNWLMFGPVTIPSNGATLIWYDKTLRYKDGYEIKITPTFSSALTFTDFTSPAIYSEADDSVPSATYAIDTLWEYKSIAIPASYNGQQIAFAFHHNATDMDVLFLDELTIIEGAQTCDADFTIAQDTNNLFNFTVFNNSSSGSGYSYLWDFGDSTTSTLQYPTHNYSWSGPFQLCSTVTDGNGCSDTFCDSLVAGRSSSTGITLTVVPPLVTSIVELIEPNLLSVYPNPSSSSTTIHYTLSEISVVEICVYDLLGNKVINLESGKKSVGNHRLNWNVEGLSEGMYMIQLNTAGKISTQKIIVNH
ncbi:MAG: repeat-containing protein [Bacteroidetes bacterium]|jgi:PKD repeat protein|nr:repeat-containing protein [Bacteroidota bacterium]